MKQHTDPRTLRLLAEWLEKVPLLDAYDLPWNVKGVMAKAHFAELLSTKSQVVNGLPMIQHLHREYDWKRGSRSGSGPYWELYVYIERDGARLQLEDVRSFHEGRLDGLDHTGIPFFAPPPPPISRKKNFVEKYRAWEYACHNDLW